MQELVESINILSEILNKQETLCKQLTADVVHELRTPITTLSTHIEMLILNVWQATPEVLENLYNEINRLNFIVKDLESLSKSDNDTLKLEKSNVNIKELVQQCKNTLSAEANEKNIEIIILGPNLYAKIDNRFYQVIFNILYNAIRYSNANSKVEVSLYENPEHVFIAVKDNGIGISKEDLPYIFERFYRSDKSRNRHTGGSGIGFTIAKSIVDTHGDSVTVESYGKSYSKFTIKLPK